MNNPGPSRSTAPKCDVEIDIAIESPAWATFEDASGLAKKVIAATLSHLHAELGPGAEISLLLCDDAAISALNSRWRGQNKPTNVLSFPTAGGAPTAEAPMLGDIAIAYETLAREAADEDKSLAAHFAHLVVHGVLHLLGYDHESEAEADVMEEHERTILAALGVADPYRQTLARVDEAP